MRRVVMCLVAMVLPAWMAGCAGYNLQLGTGSDASSPGGFYEVYEKPATSAATPAERSSSGRVPVPPPDSAPAESDPKSRDRAGGSTK